jgi:rod shape-determining protein MreC
MVFVVFIGLTASKRDRVSIFEGVVGNVLNPVQKYLYAGGQRINNLFSFIGNISNIRKENEALKAKNTELENKLIDYEALKAENTEFKEMVNFKNQNSQYKYLGASVIGKGSGNWYDVFIIDKGSNQNVKKYYPVVTSRGLVGQVVEVGPNWSKVMSVVDEKSRVQGMLSRTRDQGIVQGVPSLNGDKFCRMLYLPVESQVQVGDFVVTSELSKFYPKNIKIGVVSEISENKADFTKTATIEPVVDFTKLEEVFVITNAISDADYPPEEN